MKNAHCLMGLMTIGLLFSAGCSTLSKRVTTIATNDQSPNTENKPKKVLGQFTQIHGTEQLVAPITVQYNDRLGYGKSSKGAVEPVYNYVFLNRQDLTTRRLFPQNQWQILETQQIGDPGNTVKNQNRTSSEISTTNVKSIWYVVVKKDTNNNQELDFADKRTIAIANADGSNYQEVIKDVDDIHHIHNKNKDSRVVVYQVGKQYFAASIDIPTKTATIKEIPPID